MWVRLDLLEQLQPVGFDPAANVQQDRDGRRSSSRQAPCYRRPCNGVASPSSTPETSRDVGLLVDDQPSAHYLCSRLLEIARPHWMVLAGSQAIACERVPLPPPPAARTRLAHMFRDDLLYDGEPDRFLAQCGHIGSVALTFS